MKKLIFISTITVFIGTTCFSQSEIKIDYLQKSKNQKTAAFVLLGLGAALDIGGIIATASNANKEVSNIFSTQQNNSVNHGAEYALYIAGTACLAGSLTLFILSKSNKKKGLALGINTKHLQQIKKNNLYTITYPALSMSIRL